MTRRLGGWLGVLAAVAGPAAAQGRPAVNLITHSEVTISRPAEAIWPLIVDPNSWKQGAKLWHHAGPVGEVGEVFGAGDPADKAIPAFLVENVELERNRRRTIKLTSPGGALIGYAVFSLRGTGRQTIVGYDVYSETLLDPGQAKSLTPAALRETEQAALAANQKRFDAELVELKRRIESGR